MVSISERENREVEAAYASGDVPVVFVHGLWLLPSSWDARASSAWAIANAAYKRQRSNRAVTEIVKMPNRGHSLTIDHGWREVARDEALDFVKRFVPAAPR